MLRIDRPIFAPFHDRFFAESLHWLFASESKQEKLRTILSLRFSLMAQPFGTAVAFIV
jgi:hypothetical protein